MHKEFLEEIIGPEEATKQKAKEAACLKVLTEELELQMPDEEDATLRKAATMLSPPYALYQLLLKQDVSSSRSPGSTTASFLVLISLHIGFNIFFHFFQFF